MKILLLNYEFPPLGGGAGNATRNIAKEMALKGQDVLVVTAWFKGLLEEEYIDGYKIIRLKSKRKSLDRSNIFEMFDFIRYVFLKSHKIISSFKPEISISFFAIPTGLISLYLKVRYGIPYVLSLRGGDVPGFLPRNLKYHHMLSGPITSLVWKNSSSIVANSKGLQSLALKTASRVFKEVEYIPNGVNLSEFNSEKEILIRGEEGKINIITVGRLTEQKGVIFLIKAVDELIKENHENRLKINCKIVGDGPLRGQLEKEVRERKLTDVFIFTGWLDRKEIRKYYNSSQLFVFPSYEEGMPNVILEAIASGLAIIATDVAGNEELVSNGVNGFLYKDNSVLPSLIKNFIDNKNILVDFSKESISKSRLFSWSEVANGYIKICQKII